MDESIPIIKISSSPILSVDGQRKTPILIQEDRDRELSIQLKNETGEGKDKCQQSSSYFQPRTLEGYTKYLKPTKMEGYLEKQSLKNRSIWKKRWFIMEDSTLHYYKSKERGLEVKESQRSHQEECDGLIPLDTINSVQTADEFGDRVFRIRLDIGRDYVLRAKSKDRMHDWLFEFQRSIAQIVATILRVKNESRGLHLSHSFSRKARMSHRSASFDYRGIDAWAFSMGASPDMDTEARSAGVPSPCGNTEVRSPCSYQMFSFNYESVTECGELEVDLQSVIQQFRSPSSSPHYATRSSLSSRTGLPTSTSPRLKKSPIGRWVPPHERASFVPRSPAPMHEVNRDTTQFEMNFGEDDGAVLDDLVTREDLLRRNYGVTALVGAREKMEDVCCCLPEFCDGSGTYAIQSLYAIYDGHSGHAAAEFVERRLPLALTKHPSFNTDLPTAFLETFRQIDAEYLQLAREKNLYDGTTAAVILRRDNTLITANIGDSRAVVSVNNVAMDIISEQSPGRADERNRIENCGGWITEEKELHMARLRQMDLDDPVIRQSAEQVVRWVTIYRVNGELAVSRSIGDPDYKDDGLNSYSWAYPHEHSRIFSGDLVIPDPECQTIQISDQIQFLILACDGLWDVIDSQKAVDHVQECFTEGFTAQEASDSLARLALRYGSSDNISVIVVLFPPPSA